MTVGVDQLRKRLKRTEAIEFVLGQLGALGFTPTNWALDSKQYRFVRAFSTVWSDLTETVRQTVDFALNDFATGTPLRELSRSNYQNIQHPAVNTVGPCVLTNVGTKNYTIGVGEVLVATDAGIEFQNRTGGSLNIGATLTVTVRAVLGGSSGNVANGAIKHLRSSLAGVTVTNPAGVGGAPWYTTAGSDEESITSIRQRNRTRITTLNQISLPADGYEFLARSVAGIERVKVDDSNPRGPHTLDVYVATSTGPAGPTDVSNVQAELDAKRSPSCDPLAVAPPTIQLNPVGTVHILSAFNTPARQSEVLNAIQDFCGAVDIGGVILQPSTTGVFPVSELITAMSQIPGVVSVRLPGLTDFLLTAFEIVEPGDLSGITFLSA